MLQGEKICNTCRIQLSNAEDTHHLEHPTEISSIEQPKKTEPDLELEPGQEHLLTESSSKSDSSSSRQYNASAAISTL